MLVDIVTYKNWVFEIDKLQTKALYETIDMGGAESCVCGSCKQFIELRETIFPDEIKTLFNNLGIDITKDYEVCDYGTEEDGHHYNGWFHFVGKIKQGEDSNVPLSQGGYTLNTVPLSDSFEIGFSSKISVSYFKDHNDLIEVNFFAKLSKDMSEW